MDALGKMALRDLLDPGLPQTFDLYKTHCLQSTIKRRAVKQRMPVSDTEVAFSIFTEPHTFQAGRNLKTYGVYCFSKSVTVNPLTLEDAA